MGRGVDDDEAHATGTEGPQGAFEAGWVDGRDDRRRIQPALDDPLDMREPLP